MSIMHASRRDNVAGDDHLRTSDVIRLNSWDVLRSNILPNVHARLAIRLLTLQTRWHTRSLRSSMDRGELAGPCCDPWRIRKMRQRPGKKTRGKLNYATDFRSTDTGLKLYIKKCRLGDQ